MLPLVAVVVVFVVLVVEQHLHYNVPPKLHQLRSWTTILVIMKMNQGADKLQIQNRAI